MNSHPNPQHELKGPKVPDAIRQPQDAAEAYVKAMVAVPVMLAQLTEEVQRLADAMEMVSLYCERKGVADGLLSTEDLEPEDKDEEDGEIVAEVNG